MDEIGQFGRIGRNWTVWTNSNSSNSSNRPARNLLNEMFTIVKMSDNIQIALQNGKVSTK